MHRIRPATVFALAGALTAGSALTTAQPARPAGELALAYYYLSAQEQEIYCIANGPAIGSDGCDGELAMAIVETEEEFRLEDGTLIATSSSSHADVVDVETTQSSFVDDATSNVILGVAGAVGWQLGWLVGTAAKPAIEGAVLRVGGSVLWAMVVGGAAPWLGGIALAAGAIA